MSAFTNEQEADAEVINSLFREIKRLRRYLPMQLLQLNDGRVIRVENYEVVTTEQLTAELDELNTKVNEVQTLLGSKPDAPADPAPTAPAAPTDTTVADPNAPATDTATDDTATEQATPDASTDQAAPSIDEATVDAPTLQ
jgi:hypothetical protein